MKICKKCEHADFFSRKECPWCGNKMDGPFNIGSFLKEHVGLFTFLGVVGTFLMILPIISDFLLGPDWLYNPIDTNVIYFIIALEFGNFLLVALSLIILRELFNDRAAEGELFWKIQTGDFQRFFFCFFFIPLMGSLILFVFNSISKIPNQLALSIHILAIFVIPFLVYSIFLTKQGYEIGKGMIELWKEGKKGEVRNLIIAVVIIGIVTAILLFLSSQINAPLKVEPTDVTVYLDQEYYSPTLSKTNGIGITLKINTLNTIPILKRWSTDYGYFLSGRPPGSRFVLEGNDSIPENYWINNHDTIYWTFHPEDEWNNRTESKITIQLLKDSEKPIANISFTVNRIEDDIVLINRTPLSYDGCVKNVVVKPA